MRRQLLVAVSVATLAIVSACTSATKAATNALPGQLLSALTATGASQQQAIGGLGAMMGMAKAKLPASEWDAVTKAFPGTDQAIQTAQSMGVTDAVADMVGLRGAFTKLGMSADMADRFVPVVTNYAGTVGGEAVKTALGGVFR